MTSAFQGAEPGSATPPNVPPHPRHGQAENVYTYVNALGVPLFYVCRFPVVKEDGSRGKTFAQGRPVDGGWKWALRGVEPVLYHLDEITDHQQRNDEFAPLYILEGEKDCDRLRHYLQENGLPGTCTTSPMGAGKWREWYTDSLRGTRGPIMVVVDNDDSGKKHGRQIATDLRPHVSGAVTVLRPALDHDKADVSDHLDSGLGLEELLPLDEAIEETPAELAEGELLMSAKEFVSLQVVPPPPLWGTEAHALLVEGGFAIFAGRPGTGKTTLVIDLLCHLAAGVAYPPKSDAHADRAPEPWPVSRPLRIALIENEGPLELFRAKLRRKLEVFPHDIDEAGGYLGIQVWRWGGFSFADDDAFTKAAVELEEKRIDLVVGDPLNMLGVEGVGSPADTRQFVQRLRQLGMGLRRSFLLIHHFRERVEHHEDELRKLSGAWSGQLDSLITLAATETASEARLGFPKLRWAQGELPKAVTLGRVFNVAGFEAIGLEDDVTQHEPTLVAALNELRDAGEGYGGKGWQTSRNIAGKLGKGKMKIDAALKGAPHLFALREGEAAKVYGAKRGTKLWGLKAWPDAEQDPTPQASLPVADAVQPPAETQDEIPL